MQTKLFTVLWITGSDVEILDVQTAGVLTRQSPDLQAAHLSGRALDLLADSDDFEGSAWTEDCTPITTFSDSGDGTSPLEDLDPWARQWTLCARAAATAASRDPTAPDPVLGCTEFPILRVVARALCALTHAPTVRDALQSLNGLPDGFPPPIRSVALA